MTETAAAGPPEGGFAHRQTVYRLLPRRRCVWRGLERLLESQRQLYNAALLERCDAWRLAGVPIGWQDQFRSLTVCRREIPEMAADPVAVQRGTLKRLDEAMKGFFRRVKAGQKPGFPRFRSRRRFDSLSFVDGVRLVPGPQGRAGARLRLPGLGPLTVRRRGGDPHGDGEPAGAVLKRGAGKWYAIVCFRVAAPVREDDGRAVGVDMNAGQAAAIGGGLRPDGMLFHAPDARRLEARAKRLARRLARQKRGSGRRARTRDRLAKTRRRLAGMRRDWRPHRHRRGPAGGRHDAQRPGHRGGARLPGPAEGGAQPGRARHRLGGTAHDAGIQGRAPGGGRPAQHQPDLPCLRPCRRRLPAHAGLVHLHGLRPCGACRPQCSGKHTACPGLVPGAPGTGASARGGAFRSADPGDP